MFSTVPTYNKRYNSIRIINDTTDGLVQVSTLPLHGQDRKTKLRNNFTGLMISDGQLTLRLGELLAQKMPKKQPHEIVVGLIKSGILLSGFVALARQSQFNWSTPDKLGDYERAFHFLESHRKTKPITSTV